MSSLANKVKVQTKNKASVVYINSYKKRNIVKSYTKIDDDWLDIPRANDPTKTLPENGARLCGKIIYELHKNFDRPVYLTSHWFNKITKKKIHQNNRLRKQLSHIFNFVFHLSVEVEGEILFNVFEISYTAQAYNILNFRDEKNESNTPPIASANKLSSESINAKGHEHKSSSYIDNKEKEEHPKGCNSSFSDNKKLKIKNSTEQETQHATIAPCNLTKQGQVALTTATEEKAVELERKQRTTENTGIFAISELANTVLNEHQETENRMKIHEQVTPKITLSQERAMLLSKALFSTFGEEQSNEIQDSCKFVEQSPQRVCIHAKTMNLNDIQKTKIRKCIQFVYGKDVAISMQLTPITPQEPLRPNNLNTLSDNQKESNFVKFKNKLNHNVKEILDNSSIKVIETGDNIIIESIGFFINKLTERGAIDDLENAVIETGLSLELHTQNHYGNEIKPIILTTEKILKDRKWMENLKKSL